MKPSPRSWPNLFCLTGVLLFAAAGPRTIRAAGSDPPIGKLIAPATLAERLQSLARSNRSIVRVKSVARSLGKRDVWLVELGRGSDAARGARPAMLLVAGIEGNDPVGTAAAVGWVERLAGQYKSDETVRTLLDSTTLYVFPCVNPDAAAACFAKPLLERAVNDKPVDDDHDGMKDEDGPDDIDGDGQIVSMRVLDPDGEYIADPREPRLLIRADKAKGQRGQWRLLTEGCDDDRDERWNEDGVGGVNFNRNFPFRYEWFSAVSGVHQICEAETRALAEFVVNHQNIGIIFTFGAADNLVQTPRADSTGPTTGPAARIVTSISERDLPYYRFLGETYRKTLGLEKELQGVSQPGTFSDWMYFHRGRLSLAARAWSPTMQLELSGEKPKEVPKDDAAKAVEGGDGEAGKATSGRSGTKAGSVKAGAKTSPARPSEPAEAASQDRDFLQWLDKNAPDRFVAWHAFDHPDFPGKTVEIGGFVPFAKTVPPEKELERLLTRHADFLTTLALRLPRIAIRKVESKHLGNSVYELKIEVENTGYLPTALRQGEVTNEVYPTRVVVDLDPKAFLSGTRMTRLTAIEGCGGMKEVRCTVLVPERKAVKISAVSMLGGSAETTLQLGGEK